MEETGFFLDHVLSTSKPVVLVGSMRPGGSTSADGPMNLYEAAEVAASPQSVNRGVLMVMNDTINSPRWATKTNTTSVQTFQNPNAGPLGYVDAASIRYLCQCPRHSPAGRTLLSRLRCERICVRLRSVADRPHWKAAK